MSNYIRDTIGPATQGEQASPDQIQNSDGAYVWGVDVWTRLNRWLILGSEGGSYYATERALTRENTAVVREALNADWRRAVHTAIQVSREGRAPKNDQAIYVLAVAATYDLTVVVPIDYDGQHHFNATRAYELTGAVWAVCRTGTHILQFVSYVDKMRGWGPALRRIVGNWYTSRNANDLAYQMVKYRNRHGWSHHDVMHVAHPDMGITPKHKKLAKWAKDGRVRKNSPAILAAWGRVNDPSVHAGEVLQEIRDNRLPREALSTEWLRSPKVWEALLEDMPMTAMIRNIATMTRVGLVSWQSDASREIVYRLSDRDALTRARIHPIQILSALNTYSSGHGARGGGEWTPDQNIVGALDAAFYLSFDGLKKVEADVVVALDVSASMGWSEIAGVPGLTPRQASVAMALVTLSQYRNVGILAFSHELVSVPIHAGMTLAEANRRIGQIPMGATNCALPMLAATETRQEFDAFHIYTDSETNFYGTIQPAEALKRYRALVGPEDAKLAVVAMVSNGFTIADPNDRGMLDIVGFDTAAPNILADFTAGLV